MPEINLDTAKATAKKAGASIKSAGSLVAKKTERTKIVTVPLPRAYAELGKAVYKEASLRDQVADLFKAVDDLLSQRKQLQAEAKARPMANSLAEKAKKAAADAATMARSKAIDLQAYQAFAKLGEAIYLKHGNESGPAELVKPIAEAVARRDQLDRETASIQKESKGHWLTPNRIAWGFGIFLAVGVIGSILDPDRERGGVTGGEGGGDTSTAATGPADPGGEAMAVLRQCWIGSTPESVESLMREKGFGRRSIQNKTVEGKPQHFHFYEPGGIGFAFSRKQSTDNWGLIMAYIDGEGYFAPMSRGDKPIRMK